MKLDNIYFMQIKKQCVLMTKKENNTEQVQNIKSLHGLSYNAYKLLPKLISLIYSDFMTQHLLLFMTGKLYHITSDFMTLSYVLD